MYNVHSAIVKRVKFASHAGTATMYTVQADVRTWTVYNFSGSRQLLRYTVQYTVKRENKLCVGELSIHWPDIGIYKTRKMCIKKQ